MKWHVTMKVRQRGAIGAWEKRRIMVRAFDMDAALSTATAEFHARGFETGGPVSAIPIVEET